VHATLWGGADGFREALRRLFGYRAEPTFLRDVAPLLVIGGAVWVYHWYMVRAQAALADDTPRRPGSIAWPRRPAVALLTLLGHTIAVLGTISSVWLGLDALLNHGLQGSDWWRERLSGGLAAVVGGVAWLGAWAVLQRAASASPTASQEHYCCVHDDRTATECVLRN
jgi:hypothetical protein